VHHDSCDLWLVKKAKMKGLMCTTKAFFTIARLLVYNCTACAGFLLWRFHCRRLFGERSDRENMSEKKLESFAWPQRHG
jgi:hypothetical protein